MPSTATGDSGPPCPPEVLSEDHALVPGDNVRVELDVEVFKIMQEGHGDWDDDLLTVRFIS